MARQTWMGIGVAAVGMALVLGVPRGVAQEQEPSSSTSSGTMSASSVAENEAEYRLQIAQLRTQVVQLQQQLAQMRAQVAQNSSSSSTASQGVGGSGSAGTSAIGNPNAEAPEGATGIGYSTGDGNSASTAPASDDSGFALANILHTGRVKSITSRALVLTEEKGATTTLSLARDVEVFQNGRPIPMGRLAEGTRVRTSAPLATPGNPVMRIEVLPSR